MIFSVISDGIFQQIEIVDTSGDDQFPVMRDLNIRTGDAFVVVYSVDNMSTFYEAQNFCNLISSIKGESSLILCIRLETIWTILKVISWICVVINVTCLSNKSMPTLLFYSSVFGWIIRSCRKSYELNSYIIYGYYVLVTVRKFSSYPAIFIFQAT